ncbi:HAD-IA family hydrolase [Streptomyces luomodiensis]|uniref:HAD-IA family hydrolase n=1 Tax=Streptomyces luomodiensis TaxID=3026192 RepID=A0ABY9UUF0_9ACTN|nr:HAD-IA family hydrolase [Streptomyces sp. SCA4-21]WNE95505.1 HAD-IA family hydrolase [Streptomyces sp. SCA4-21]
MNGKKISGLLLDMNGVIRHFDDSGAAAGEALAGLPSGTIREYAYQHPSYELAKVGVMDNRQWVSDVRRRLVADFGHHAENAVEAWCEDRGTVDGDALATIRRIRREVPVGVLSNFTDALHADMVFHGMVDEFDYVFPSHDIRVQKPSPLAYLTAVERMSLEVGDVIFFDDQPAYVAGARAAGLSAFLFTSWDRVVEELDRHGVHVSH